MSETGILTALRAKLRPTVETGAAARPTTPEALLEALAGKRSAAEAQIADAEGTFRRAALDVEKGVPGAASRKAEAAAAVREAEENLRDVMGAQIEADAEMREIEAQRREAERAALDADEARWLDIYETGIAEFVEHAAPIAAGYAKALEAHGKLFALRSANPRVRNTGMQDLPTMAALELARVSPLSDDNIHRVVLPKVPNAVNLLALLPLKDQISSFVTMVRADLAKASTARKKGRAR